MTQSTRLRDIVAVLDARHHPVPRDVLLAELGVSLATFKRDLDVLRDQMQSPIVWKPAVEGAKGGYVLEDKGWSAGKLGLPRAWFSAAEIYALLMIDELAKHIGPGLLSEHLQPLITRITLALSAAKDQPDDIRSRVRVLSSASRRGAAPHFERVAQATVRRERLRILYFTRSRNERSERVVSPQRLIHYKENWYLIAHCHKVKDLRIFALDAIESATVLAEAALRVKATSVDAMIGSDFGIYAGKKREWAHLRFSAAQARWVRAETWHPDQRMTELEDGGVLLEVPYSDARELLLEICRFGPDVEVLKPSSLRKAVAKRLESAAAIYRE